MVTNKFTVDVFENLRGGKGVCEIHRFLPISDFMGHGKLFGNIVIKPQSSIGYHQHVDETEWYYITKGTGKFIDNEKVETIVKPGDLCSIKVDESHSIENVGEGDLELIALILFKESKSQ